MLGGGSFTGKQTTKVAAGGVLRLAGDFSVSGEVEFTGRTPEDFGTLELGTENEDADFVLADGAKAIFNLPGQTVCFNRGQLRGTGTVENLGKLIQKAPIHTDQCTLYLTAF